MPAADTCAPPSLPSADRRRISRAAALGCALVVASCLGSRAFAQASDSPTAQDPTAPWTATTDLRSDALSPQRTRVRIVESHTQNGDRKLDTRSVEIRRTDGHFEPYQEIESETLSVDASTVRTTTRTFARDVNGRKALVQVTEEERHASPEGNSSVLRITSNPDVNGRLKPAQRELVETKKIGEDLEETNTTVMLPSLEGGLAPAFKTQETRRRVANDTVESEKSIWMPDFNRKWQLSETRQATTRQEGTNRTTEERVSRLDSEGKLGEISHVVTRESESTPGEKCSVLETYSIDVPGTARDGRLHLIERQTNTESSSSTGERTTEQKVEQINPGDPTSGLRVSVLVDGRMVPGPSGEQSTVTIRARDVNGKFGVVSVDTTNADRIPTLQLQQTPAEDQQ